MLTSSRPGDGRCGASGNRGPGAPHCFELRNGPLSGRLDSFHPQTSLRKPEKTPRARPAGRSLESGRCRAPAARAPPSASASRGLRTSTATPHRALREALREALLAVVPELARSKGLEIPRAALSSVERVKRLKSQLTDACSELFPVAMATSHLNFGSM